MFIGIDYPIYEYRHLNCLFYFYKTTKYIGIFLENSFYVINLEYGDFSEKFKINFYVLNDEEPSIFGSSDITNYLKKKEILKTLNRIKDFEYLNISCIAPKDLTRINEKLKVMERNLCPGYTLSLQYPFEIQEGYEVSSFGYIFPSWTLLLCIYNENNCVSSLSIKEVENLIWIDSKTNEMYQGRKMNKILRAVLIIIANDLYPQAEGVCSVAVNYISCLAMKKFNAFFADENNEYIDELNEEVEEEEIKKYLRENKTITCVVELSEENIVNAQNIFDSTRMSCLSVGGKKSRKRQKKYSKNKYKQNK